MKYAIWRFTNDKSEYRTTSLLEAYICFCFLKKYGYKPYININWEYDIQYHLDIYKWRKEHTIFCEALKIVETTPGLTSLMRTIWWFSLNKKLANQDSLC